MGKRVESQGYSCGWYLYPDGSAVAFCIIGKDGKVKHSAKVGRNLLAEMINELTGYLGELKESEEDEAPRYKIGRLSA